MGVRGGCRQLLDPEAVRKQVDAQGQRLSRKQALEAAAAEEDLEVSGSGRVRVAERESGEERDPLTGRKAEVGSGWLLCVLPRFIPPRFCPGLSDGLSGPTVCPRSGGL